MLRLFPARLPTEQVKSASEKILGNKKLGTNRRFEQHPSVGLPALRQRMSKESFPSGPWLGFYNYNFGRREKHRMDLILTFANGSMTGEGSDDVGRFLVKGRRRCNSWSSNTRHSRNRRRTTSFIVVFATAKAFGVFGKSDRAGVAASISGRAKPGNGSRQPHRLKQKRLSMPSPLKRASSAGSRGKPLKRLTPRRTSEHRAKAPVFNESSWSGCEISGLEGIISSNEAARFDAPVRISKKERILNKNRRKR